MNKKEINRAYMKIYNQTPEQKERNLKFMREYNRRPEIIERKKIYQSRWRLENSSKKKKQDAEYYKKNKETILKHIQERRALRPPYQLKLRLYPVRKTCRENYSNNRDAFRRRTKLYAKRHPELIRQRNSDFRARRIGAVGNHDQYSWIKKVEYHGWKCSYCKKKLTPSTLTKDHVIPLSKGGSDWLSNLLPCCKNCNSKKGAKTVKEFMPL